MVIQIKKYRETAQKHHSSFQRPSSWVTLFLENKAGHQEKHSTGQDKGIYIILLANTPYRAF